MKIHVFEVLIVFLFLFCFLFFLENVLLESISVSSLQILSLENILLGYFTLSSSMISMEDLIRLTKGAETFLIDHYAGDQNITGKHQKILALVSPILFLAGQFTQDATSIILWFIYVLFICI